MAVNIGHRRANLNFEEDVDPSAIHAGPLRDGIERSLYKIKSNMCSFASLHYYSFAQKIFAYIIIAELNRFFFVYMDFKYALKAHYS